VRALSVATFAVAVLLGVATGTSDAQGLFSAAHDPVAGEKLFASKGCAQCHAIAGKGGRIGPDLARTTRARTFYDLAASLWNHAPKMSARIRAAGGERPRLDARELGDLAAYLYTVDYFGARGNVTTGRRLFADKQCASCHGPTGTGTDAGPDLGTLKQHASPIGIATAMWNHAPRMADVMRRRGIVRPTFAPGELNDLIAYLQSVAPKTSLGRVYVLPGRALDGRRIFLERRCVECHPIVSTAGDERPNLVERVGHLGLVDFAAAMWNKAPAMQEALSAKNMTPPRLRPDEMADVVAYLYSIRYFRAAGDPRRGVLLAVNKGCLDCHALYGEPGKPASDLTTAKDLDAPAGVLAALWNHSLIDDPRPERERRSWPTFRGEEMADLAAYLRTLKRAP
jgi:mono/diheme cytochrome c family protein